MKTKLFFILLFLTLSGGKMYAQCATVSRCITNLPGLCGATVKVTVCWSWCTFPSCPCNASINPACVGAPAPCAIACNDFTIPGGSTSCVTIPAGADPSCTYHVTVMEADGVTPELDDTFPYMLGEDLHSHETKRGSIEFIVNDDGSISIKACN